jgi:type II secretory pathway component PulF
MRTFVRGPIEASPIEPLATAVVLVLWSALALGLLVHLHRPLAVGLRALGMGLCARIPLLSGFGRLLHAERTLRALSPSIAGGAPLSRALRIAAPAAGDPRSAAAAEGAAAAADAGERAERVWRCAGLPAFAAARLAAASARAPAAFARTLDALAEECAARFEARLERFLRWAQPLVIAFFGLVLALHFSALFEVVDRVRIEGGLW